MGSLNSGKINDIYNQRKQKTSEISEVFFVIRVIGDATEAIARKNRLIK